jgi:hypothetical protein
MRRKISTTAAIILIAAVLIATVAGTILYTLTKSGSWNVRTAVGLQLTYADGTEVTALSFTVDPLSAQTQNFILKNLANHAVNTTSIIPASTSLYTLTTTFVNNTLAQGGSYPFSITLTDLGMDSSATYNGDFKYLIVSDFNAGISTDTFSTTTVNYASDSAQYFGFVNDGFNASGFPVGSTVLYSFTTENINQTYQIEGLTYKLEIYDSLNNLVSTVCDGLTVAYWQNSTAYGTFGNGTHMTTQPLMPNRDITIWNSFAAPAPAGVYHAILTYQSHNAQPVPPPQTPITWTIIKNCPASTMYLSNPVITGATQTNEAGTVAFSITYNGGNSYVICDFTVTVPQLGLTIYASSELGFTPGQTRPYNIPFTMTQGGSLTMLVTVGYPA